MIYRNPLRNRGCAKEPFRLLSKLGFAEESALKKFSDAGEEVIRGFKTPVKTDSFIGLGIEKAAIDMQQKENVKRVYMSYLKWFFGAIFLATSGTIGACLLNDFYPLSGMQIRVFQIFSLALESASLGQGSQTWCGDAVAEKLNQKLFTLLSGVGFLLITISFQLESP